MDAGLLNAITTGVSSFVPAYQQSKANAEEQALRRRQQRLQMAQSGMQETPEGDIQMTPEASDTRALQKATQQAGLLRSGYRAVKNQETGEYDLEPVAGFKDQEQELRDLQLQKLRKEINAPAQAKDEFGQLPIENQEQIKDLSKKIAEKTNIKNSLQGGLNRLEDKNLDDDQKLVQARQMIKLLNSQAGQDAVGAEEAKRLAGFLEFRYFNLTEPGPLMGRAPISEFTEQVKQTLRGLNEATEYNRRNIDQLYGRNKSPSQPVNLNLAKRDIGLLNRQIKPTPGAGMETNAIADEYDPAIDDYAKKYNLKYDQAQSILRSRGYGN